MKNSDDAVLSVREYLNQSSREKRLYSFLGLLSCKNHDAFRCVKSVFDHEGFLTVEWLINPTEIEMNDCLECWRQLNEDQIEHVVCDTTDIDAKECINHFRSHCEFMESLDKKMVK